MEDYAKLVSSKIRLIFQHRANEQVSQHQYLGSEDNIIIGSCVGEISAAAVGLANSLIELLPLAVVAVRVAFRLAVVAYQVSKEVEQPIPGRQCWSIAISKNDHVIDQGTLDRIHTELVSDHWGLLLVLNDHLLYIGNTGTTSHLFQCFRPSNYDAEWTAWIPKASNREA